MRWPLPAGRGYLGPLAGVTPDSPIQIQSTAMPPVASRRWSVTPQQSRVRSECRLPCVPVPSAGQVSGAVSVAGAGRATDDRVEARWGCAAWVAAYGCESRTSKGRGRPVVVVSALWSFQESGGASGWERGPFPVSPCRLSLPIVGEFPTPFRPILEHRYQSVTCCSRGSPWPASGVVRGVRGAKPPRARASGVSTAEREIPGERHTYPRRAGPGRWHSRR